MKSDPDLKPEINPHLLEQAIVNLLDNAIKFSNGSDVVVHNAEEKDR